MINRLIPAVAAMLIALPAVAQQAPPPGAGGPPPQDPLAAAVFPPELIMQNQEAIGLSEEQRTYMIAEVQRVQSQAMTIQWRMQREVEKLAALLRQDRSDEARVLTQVDTVLSVEREMKRMQMTLLVRLKNRLTPDQRTRLRELQAAARPRED